MNIINLVIFFLSFIALSQEEANSLIWEEDFEMTLHKAKSEKKPIIMYFNGSDWCAPCKKLKEDFFNNEKLNKYKSSFIFHMVDIPRNQDLLTEEQMKQNYSLLKTYNKNKSFPMMIVLSSDGKIFDKISGYSALRDPRFHFELLEMFSK